MRLARLAARRGGICTGHGRIADQRFGLSEGERIHSRVMPSIQFRRPERLKSKDRVTSNIRSYDINLN